MESRSTMTAKVEYNAHDEVEFLSFMLGEEHYALDIMSV